jgi:hypothetical protein
MRRVTDDLRMMAADKLAVNMDVIVWAAPQA